MPIWNIGAFTLLDGKLVLLGGEEEVRRVTGARGREEEGEEIDEWGEERIMERGLPPLYDFPLLWTTGSSPVPGGEC